MDVLEDKKVITRKPHNCWGCMRLFPIGTSMQYTTCVDGGIAHCYWCDDCIKFMNTLESWEKMDGFCYGELLNYDEYKATLTPNDGK